MTAFDLQLERIAQAPRLLIACDYDGVIAPIAADPSRAIPLPEMVECLDRLAALRQTDVAVVSGRSIESLRLLLNQTTNWHLIGCHGAEWADRRWTIENQISHDAFQPLLVRLRELSLEVPGCMIEEKPYGIAFHYRNVEPRLVEGLMPRLLALANDRPSVMLRRGKMVVEFSITSTNKGDAFKRLRYLTGATAAVFVGDDVTDEDAFQTLGEPDLGISVGGRRQGATFDLADSREVLVQFQRLLSLRLTWDKVTQPRPIENHSVLSDQRCLALIDDRGTLDWFCVPRLDVQSIFASLLGHRIGLAGGEPMTAGEFSVRPSDAAASCRQSYVGDSWILRTEWPDFVVTDYLDCAGGRPFQRAGNSELVRLIEGTGRVRISFAPRLNFGHTVTTLSIRPKGLVIEGQPDPVVLYSPGVAWEIMKDGPHHTAVAEFDLSGSPVLLELRYGTGSFRDAVVPEPRRREQTEKFWSTWAGSLKLPSIASDHVRRSALVLKGLTYGPTGAISAAATTSLPECRGGQRNWDYRYCWPRDAALAAAALVRLGNTGQAMRLLDWLLAMVDRTGSPERLRPVYSVTGHDLGPEGEISELSGYAQSRPVRVGNAASQQVQLDIFGPIVDLAWLLIERGAPLTPEHWRLVEAMVTAVEQRWQEPDNGIWEVRGPRRHYVHSKVMCWLAVDRAVKTADAYLGQHKSQWDSLRDRIADEVLMKGWDEPLGAFRMAYEVPELDAASLLIGITGLIPPRDPRFIRTVENVDRCLRKDGAVFRYRFDDGLPGQEAGFLLCLGWLIEAYVLIGDKRKATELFERLLACAGPTGLLAEQYDPQSAAGLGNFPQAYSHLALINAAVALDGAGPK